MKTIVPTCLQTVSGHGLPALFFQAIPHFHGERGSGSLAEGPRAKASRQIVVWSALDKRKHGVLTINPVQGLDNARGVAQFG